MSGKTAGRPERRPATPARSRSSLRRQDLGDRDPMGRMALFSDVEPEPVRPGPDRLTLECSSCLAESPVSAFALARAALPFSVHLPFARRYSSYMRCPACERRTWLRIRVRI